MKKEISIEQQIKDRIKPVAKTYTAIRYEASNGLSYNVFDTAVQIEKSIFLSSEVQKIKQTKTDDGIIWYKPKDEYELEVIRMFFNFEKKNFKFYSKNDIDDKNNALGVGYKNGICFMTTLNEFIESVTKKIDQIKSL